jgi:hypothetical protein
MKYVAGWTPPFFHHKTQTLSSEGERREHHSNKRSFSEFSANKSSEADPTLHMRHTNGCRWSERCSVSITLEPCGLGTCLHGFSTRTTRTPLLQTKFYAYVMHAKHVIINGPLRKLPLRLHGGWWGWVVSTLNVPSKRVIISTFA